MAGHSPERPSDTPTAGSTDRVVTSRPSVAIGKAHFTRASAQVTRTARPLRSAADMRWRWRRLLIVPLLASVHACDCCGGDWGCSINWDPSCGPLVSPCGIGGQCASDGGVCPEGFRIDPTTSCDDGGGVCCTPPLPACADLGGVCQASSDSSSARHPRRGLRGCGRLLQSSSQRRRCFVGRRRPGARRAVDGRGGRAEHGGNRLLQRSAMRERLRLHAVRVGRGLRIVRQRDAPDGRVDPFDGRRWRYVRLPARRREHGRGGP